MPLRIANWNVYNGTLAGMTPDARMTAFAAYCATVNVDVIGFQEVPTGALAIAAPGWTTLSMNSEYPPTPANPAPASATTVGYVVLYNAARVVPTTALDFLMPTNFVPLRGAAQSRPPVACSIRNVANTANCRFSVWHNEAGARATLSMAGLHNTYIGTATTDVIVGDFNVPAQTALRNPFFPGWNAVTDNLDAILSNVGVQDVAIPAPFKSDVHFAMIAEIDLGW
ncbi:endonuclease/exonuclease/phosphatase family protein [Magnetospirillum fulvum]|uniref:Endonuclease/Exonuclease/phosphatase family protein n=1 Tax=Magnetospirillum fulvum TaxID=1082 RepID=A0A1H6H008_MAGFU|nr:endonuclease/exonuclease/phosphatase family protein [Magnetospirillum fulvum]SEH28502.1 Endonuclease/Exonuclease/phosphatase family protein [Magnetospirillum fulvum]